jgi:hypothetical protein
MDENPRPNTTNGSSSYGGYSWYWQPQWWDPANAAAAGFSYEYWWSVCGRFYGYVPPYQYYGGGYYYQPQPPPQRTQENVTTGNSNQSAMSPIVREIIVAATVAAVTTIVTFGVKFLIAAASSNE